MIVDYIYKYLLLKARLYSFTIMKKQQPKNPKEFNSRTQMEDSFQELKDQQQSQGRSPGKFITAEAGIHSQKTKSQFKSQQQQSTFNNLSGSAQLKMEQKVELKSSEDVENERWTNFSKSMQKQKAPEGFLQILRNKVYFLGEFSPEVTDLIRSNFEGKAQKKILKSYRKYILLPLISSVLSAVQIKTEDMKEEQLADLQKAIGQGNQEGIIQALDKYIETEDQMFATIISSLLQFHKEQPQQSFINEQQEQDFAKEIDQLQQKDGNDEESNMIKHINKETQDFTRFIESKGIKVDPSIVEQLMMIKFNHGPFSLQLETYINGLTEIKKPIKTRLQKAFDEMFRDFDLGEQSMEQLTQLEVEEKEINELKEMIRKKEENKIKDKLKEFFDQGQDSQKRIQKFAQQLLSSRPSDSSSSFLRDSSFSSQQSLNTLKKNNVVTQIPNSVQQPIPNSIGKMESQKLVKNQKGSIQQQKKPVEKPTENQQKNQKTKNNKKQEYRQKDIQAKAFRNQSSQKITGPKQKQSKNKSEHNQFVGSHIPKSKDPTLKLQKIDEKHSDYNQDRFSNNKINQGRDRGKAQKSRDQAFINSSQDFPTLEQRFGKTDSEFPQFSKQSRQHNQYMQGENQFYDKMEIEHSNFETNRVDSNWGSSVHEAGHMRYQQPMKQTRYILVIKDKKTNLQLKTSTGFTIDLKSVQVNRKDTKKVTAAVYRLDLDPQIDGFSLYQPGWFGGVFKTNQRKIWNKDLYRGFLRTESFVNKQNYDENRRELSMFYLLTVLYEYSRVGQPLNFWGSLCNLKQFLAHPSRNQMYDVWMMIESQNNKRISFSPECSRILLYFLDSNASPRISFGGMQSPLIQKIAFMTNFDEFYNRLQVFDNSYSHQNEAKLILYCMIHKFSQRIPINDQFLHKNLNQTFTLVQSFDDKIKMTKSLRRISLEKMEQLYPMIKDSVELRHYSLFEFLAFRFTLINVQEKNQDYRNDRLDQSKRLWMNQTLREARNFIDTLSVNQIVKQNQQLERLKQYQEDIREILTGKSNNGNYFLFNHELFFDFYSELTRMRKIKNVNILQFFSKHIQSKIVKGFEFVILRTSKSPNMIALMCSLGKVVQEHLLKIIDKIENRNHILQIVPCWFRDEFKKQNNDFFVKVFLRIMEFSKIETFTAFQFMRTIEQFSQKNQMKEEVENFEKIVMEKIKKVIPLIELRLHLLQIKDIKQPVRRIYLQELAFRLEQQRPSLKTLQQVASEVIYDEKISRKDRDLVLKKLFQNRNEKDKNKDTLRQQIIDYYGQGKKQILALAYYNHFDKSLKELIKLIEEGETCYGIVENMNRQKIKLYPESSKEEFIRLGQLLNKDIKQFETLKRQSNSLISVLKDYNGIFDKFIEELVDWNRKLPQNEVKNSIKNLKKFTEYLIYSEQISSLMKISLWDKESIQSMPDLLTMRTNTINQFHQLIDSFEKQTLNYKEFKKYFKVDILSTLLENVKDKNSNFKKKLQQYINYLDEKTLNNFATSIQAINQIHQDIQNKNYFDPSYLETIETLQNPKEDITIEEAFTLITTIDSKHKKIGFNVLDEDEQILKTLIYKQKYKRVFDTIIEKKIDSSTILNDLKEYINDVQNSILKIQDIKELQNVVLFSEQQRKAKNFQIFLKDFRKQVETKKLKLSENIFNVDSKLQQFDQMIDSSANRQTSFKYDLQQIFKSSTVRIKNENGFAHVEIETKEKKLMSEGINAKKQEKSTFNFKKLTEFKDKAILLVSDFEKSNENQNIMKQTIDLFKEYLSLYKILEGIETALNQAIIYGYNPKDLNHERNIKNRNFKEILGMKEEIQKLTKEWIQEMKKMYDQSYLLTHFMGPRLNVFINDTLEFKLSPLIKKIIDLDETQFGKLMDSLQFIGFNVQNSSPIDKVKRICGMFHKFQVNTLKRYQRASMIEENQQRSMIKNRIELITCVNVQNYYYALVKGNSKPEMNEILYCQKETSFEEIEVFIKRAIIKNHRKHYFIGVHYLPAEVQLKFIDLLNEYLTQKKRQMFNRCKLSFIDGSPVEKVYLHLCKKQLFNAKQITDTHLKNLQENKSLFRNIGQTYLVESRISGLGKTYWAEKKKDNSNVVHFSIAGHVHFSRLLERLKAKNFVEDRKNTLIIQIGHVENKNKLEIFLFQLIFFKGFNFKQFFFLPKETTIIVEIENVYQNQDKYALFSILKIIKEHKEKYVCIDNFRLDLLKPDFADIEEAFTLYYLISINQKTILKDQKPFQIFQTKWRNQNAKICNDEEARKLIKLYFCDPLQKGKTQPTFSLYKSFIKLLFIAFKTFSQNGCLAPWVWESSSRSNRDLGLANLRLDFLNCSIMNCIKFLQATVNTNEFDQEQENKGKMITQEDFRKTLTRFPFLIMPAYDFQSYQFVYLHSEDVNISIKSLIISQTIDEYMKFNKHGYEKATLRSRLTQKIVQDLFSQNALQSLKEDALEREIYSILFQLSGNPLFNIPSQITIKEFKNQHDQIKNYSITLDNFFKMCLIIQRAVSHIPIIIMGESGVGKTALIRFLVQVVFRHQFLVFNVHAGVDEQKLVEYYREILEASDRIKPLPKQKVWVFFDEFNTTDELSYIKEMIVDRKFQGQHIPENVVLIGACNPYRRKKQSNYKHAGIKKKNTQQANENSSDLAFKVKPPSLSMIQFMWDYQQLQLKQNLHYISKILQSLQLTQNDKVVLAIATLHQDFKKTYEISSVSLRDVARFKQLYMWFLNNMPRRPDNKKGSKRNPNYEMNDEERAISLSIAFCYSLRIADRQQRRELLRKMTTQLQLNVPIEKVVQNEQIDYVERLKISTQRIAINFSLRQNVFTTLVCIMNKIPILIIGNPGNSKSLSIRMISSNLRGSNSESQFCIKFPELSIIYFQGSEVCTSKGVETVFEKAITSNNAFKKKKQSTPGLGDVQNCVLFDEIGLAEKSIHNPLKVLHSRLETTNKQICFIGISNWELDAAKMSRFLVLSRSNPQKQQLRDTAIKILESYLKREAMSYEKTFREMSDCYYEFVEQWDQNNKGNQKEGFFGLRDFYCYIKFVAGELEKGNNSNIDDIIRRAIYTNFDGQEESVELFLNISGLGEIQKEHTIDPINLVQQNLSKDSSRSLLLIVRGDALLPIIQNRIKINGQKRRIQCIYGSTFASDQQSEEYNLEITSIIISHMSRGTILTFKNPNNSIQTSLYDVFNKSFTISGPKKYCRVAVGANSNPKCVVHESFGSVVFMDEQTIKNTDLAFLNRFQKHFLTLSNVLSNFEKQIVNQIKGWIENLTKFKSKTQYKMQEHYLVNSSQESIVTLVIKYRHSLENYKESGIKKIKKALLKNATQHFFIALKSGEKNFIPAGLRSEVDRLLKEIQNENKANQALMEEDQHFQDIMAEQQAVPRDKIIFTYDMNIYSTPTYMFCTDKTLKIRISEVKSEKQLRKSLKDAFTSDKIDNIHILIDFHKQFHHVNFVSFLITGLKNSEKSNKTIYIIIKLSQTSLQNSNRDHINISYLLDFEQRFIDSLTLGKSFMEAIQNKTVKQLYVERKMSENFDNFYIQAQRRFRIMINQKDLLKGVPGKDIEEFQFDQMMKMNENEAFKKEALIFIYENLSEDKIDISIILSNKEDRNLCGSPQQSFEKYLQNCVMQVICLFFDRIYRNNLLFAFDVPKLFNFLKKYYDVQILEIIYEQSKQVYDKFLGKLLDAFVKDKSLFVNQYLKAYNSNRLEIRSLCLLPMGLVQLEYISSNSEDSLFKTSSKILQLSVNQEQDVAQQCQLLVEKCLSILNEKSVFLKSSLVQKGAFDFEKLLNQNNNLQIFYFFDMISKIYSESIESINTQIFPLEKLVYLFVQIFRKLKIKQKVILLSLSKELWSNLFNIWSLWITHKDKNFHTKIESHYLQNHIIKEQSNEPHQLPKLLTELCRSTLILQEQLLRLDVQNIENYGMQKYLSFFRKTYFYIQKIRLTCMDLKVETSETMKATKRFFDILDELYQREEIEEQLTVFLTTNENSFESKVERYLSGVLQGENQTDKEKDDILSYLSLDIYGMWIKRLKSQNQQGENVERQLQSCIKSFIKYSDQYPSFANNSGIFLQIIFEQLIDDALTIEEKLQYIEHQQDEMAKTISEKITLSSNFAVALGNFFMKNIKLSAQREQDEEGQRMGMNEANNEPFIKKYIRHFQKLIKRNHYPNKVFEVYSIEFLKYYCLRYLEAINYEQERSTTWRVDQLLCETSQIADTLRLYLLKNILYREQKMTLVKENYLDNKKCKWLEHLKVLVNGKTFQLLTPPPFEEESRKMSQLTNQFRNQQYEKMEIFAQIVQESFASPITKYQFLTFMMNDVYTRSCPEDRVLKIAQIINTSEQYKNAENHVELKLLNCYINHKVTSVLKYEIREMELPQKKIEEFVATQLVFINFLNIFVACRNSECPLIEMFFEMNGNVPQNYIAWLENRFLINGRENQSVSILKRFIQLGDNTPGYYKCSSNCDMFYTIGGSGGFGCQLPKVEGICGWCNQIIGGKGHSLTRANQGARKVELPLLPQELEIIREKRKLEVLNHKLSGYSYSLDAQEMIKEVQSNRRMPDSSKFILQQMMFTVWSFLASTGLLPEQTIKELFHMNSNAFEAESYEIMRRFYVLETKTLNLNEEDQSNLVWHLGISKQIMKFIIEYKNKLSNQMKQKMGLVKCIGRDTFEQYLVDNVILKHSSGNQKLALVNTSRCVKAGVNFQGQQILRETGGYDEHLQKYPKIRLIKLLQENKAPCYDNFVEQYKEKIDRDFKILSYYIDNEENIQKLIKYRTLYTFITKILKIFNMKVTRRDAKEKTIVKLYEQVYRGNFQGEPVNTEDLNNFREEVVKFCEVWNELREGKFDLKYGCHSFGLMNQVTAELQLGSYAINFFPDKKYKGDQKGQMILSLLQVTAQQYNDICRQITHRKMGDKKYRQIEIFNPKPINPTQVQSLTKTLVLNRQIVEGIYISTFSGWSVEYGCGLPHYSIGKIQSLLVEGIVGCHNLNEEIKDYDEINFVGEQLNLILEIRGLNNQLNWDKIPKKEEIEKYVYTLKYNDPDSFLKEITSIKGSLELILYYCRLRKDTNFQKMTIEEFIANNKIKILSKILQKQELFYNIGMGYIVALYEFIELHTLKNSVECLNDSYKKEKLSEMEERNLKLFIEELKKQYKPEEDIYYHITVALYRFAVRSLLLVEQNQSLILFDFLYDGAQLWPNHFNMERLANVKFFREAFLITLTKIQSLLDMIPLEIRKTKTEVLFNDQKKSHQEFVAKNTKPETIKKNRTSTMTKQTKISNI